MVSAELVPTRAAAASGNGSRRPPDCGPGYRPGMWKVGVCLLALAVALAALRLLTFHELSVHDEWYVEYSVGPWR